MTLVELCVIVEKTETSDNGVTRKWTSNDDCVLCFFQSGASNQKQRGNSCITSLVICLLAYLGSLFLRASSSVPSEKAAWKYRRGSAVAGFRLANPITSKGYPTECRRYEPTASGVVVDTAGCRTSGSALDWAGSSLSWTRLGAGYRHTER